MLFPPGVPKAMYVLLTPLEFLSNLIVRPATHAIRLFANMFAGHLLIATFSIAAFDLLSASSVIGILGSAASFVGGRSALTGFEALIQFLQAYIFTLLHRGLHLRRPARRALTGPRRPGNAMHHPQSPDRRNHRRPGPAKETTCRFSRKSPARSARSATASRPSAPVSASASSSAMGVQAIARQPEAYGVIRQNMILGFALAAGACPHRLRRAVRLR